MAMSQNCRNVNFVKKATINWTCHSLEDLDILSERFLIFGARVYVEFGWVLPGSNISRGTFVDSNGKVDLQESQKSINSQLAKKVIELGPATGHTTVTMGQALKDSVSKVGHINSYDIWDDQYWGTQENCQKEINEWGVQEFVTLKHLNFCISN
mgnify:CR=1 FL=1